MNNLINRENFSYINYSSKKLTSFGMTHSSDIERNSGKQIHKTVENDEFISTEKDSKKNNVKIAVEEEEPLTWGSASRINKKKKSPKPEQQSQSPNKNSVSNVVKAIGTAISVGAIGTVGFILSSGKFTPVNQSQQYNADDTAAEVEANAISLGLNPPVIEDNTLANQPIEREEEDIDDEPTEEFAEDESENIDDKPIEESPNKNTEVNPEKNTNVVPKTTVNTNLSGKSIVIDPGHGGKDSGAVGNGLLEKDINLEFSKNVQKALTNHKVGVTLTRNTDSSDNGDNFPTYLNKYDGASNAFISIHSNSVDDSTVCGVEIFAEASEESNVLAKTIYKHIKQEMGDEFSSHCGRWDRGVKDASTSRAKYIKRAGSPSVLIELGFVSHSKDASMLSSPELKAKYIKAISEGVEEYLAQK